MKRFIFGICTSIVFITIGGMMSVFELKDYRVVNGYNKIYGENITHETVVNEEHPLRIKLDNDVDVSFDIDNELKENVEIDIPENIEFTWDANRLEIEDYEWFSFPLGRYIDTVIDGLKEKKIYYHDDYYMSQNDEIVIRCSEKAREYIRISD